MSTGHLTGKILASLALQMLMADSLRKDICATMSDFALAAPAQAAKHGDSGHNTSRTRCQLGWCAMCGARILSLARPSLHAPACHSPRTHATQTPLSGAAEQRSDRTGGFAAFSGRNDDPCCGCAVGGRSERPHHDGLQSSGGRLQLHGGSFEGHRALCGRPIIILQPKKGVNTTNQPINTMCDGG